MERITAETCPRGTFMNKKKRAGNVAYILYAPLSIVS
jgi:hypothetical protein